MLIGEVARRIGDRPEPATHLARELRHSGRPSLNPALGDAAEPALTTALADPDLTVDEAKRVAALGPDAAC